MAEGDWKRIDATYWPQTGRWEVHAHADEHGDTPPIEVDGPEQRGLVMGSLLWIIRALRGQGHPLPLKLGSDRVDPFGDCPACGRSWAIPYFGSDGYDPSSALETRFAYEFDGVRYDDRDDVPDDVRAAHPEGPGSHIVHVGHECRHCKTYWPAEALSGAEA